MKIKLTKEQLIYQYETLKLDTVQIAKKYDVHPETIRMRLVNFGIPRRSRRGGGQNIKTIVGRKFGKLTVIKQVKNKLNTSAKWFCKCDCGNTVNVVRNSLIKGLTTSCGCVRIEKQLRYYNDLSYSFWGRIVNGAVKRGLEFSITIEQAWDIYIKQNKKCALTGLSINLVKNLTRDRDLQTASLDRINSELGYTIDNIQWVHKDINIFKNNWTQDKFIYYCRKVVEYEDRSKKIDR